MTLTANASIQIQKPIAEVFEAIVDPEKNAKLFYFARFRYIGARGNGAMVFS